MTRFLLAAGVAALAITAPAASAPHGGGHGPTYTVGRATVGLVRDFQLNGTTTMGVGGSWAFNFVPDVLEPDYGGDPDGALVFVRLRIQ